MTTRTAHRNLAAECRAVEEGHRCRLDRDRGEFLVASDSVPGRTYTLTALGIGGLLVVSCVPCPTSRAYQLAGVVRCKHRALVARRLEREGLVRFDGDLWRLTDRAEGLAPPVVRRDPYAPRGPFCPACDLRVDPYVEIPVAMQERVVDGVSWHRGCGGS